MRFLYLSAPSPVKPSQVRTLTGPEIEARTLTQRIAIARSDCLSDLAVSSTAVGS
jgi:hypothetical protein